MTFEQGGMVTIKRNVPRISVPYTGKRIIFSGSPLESSNPKDLMDLCHQKGAKEPTLAEYVALLWAAEKGFQSDPAIESVRGGLLKSIRIDANIVTYTAIYCDNKQDLWIWDHPSFETKKFRKDPKPVHVPVLDYKVLKAALKEGDPSVRFVKRTGAPEWYSEPMYFQQDPRIVGIVGEEGAYRLGCLFNKWFETYREGIQRDSGRSALGIKVSNDRTSNLRLTLGPDMYLESQHPILCGLSTKLYQLLIGDWEVGRSSHLRTYAVLNK